MEEPIKTSASLVALLGQIVGAYIRNNPLPMNELPAVLRNVHAVLSALGSGTISEQITTQKPAVPIKKSVTDDYIVCLEDGKKLKMLKRYLRSNYDLSPEQYRTKWGLPHDYPMVAPNYAEVRSQFAKKIGLGKTAGLGKAKRR